MTTWLVMYNKEMLELWRSYKWLWVPLVFVLLGIMQPVVSYYMPQIIENAGGLPEGTVIEIPLPTAAQVMVETLSQYNTLGILILVLAVMATVSGERTSGVAGMILIKPVSFASYVTSKWAGAVTLTAASLLLGSLSAWYYTLQLIGSLPFEHMVLGTMLYGLWLAFVMALVVAFSAILRSTGAVAFLTLLVTIGLSVLPSLFAEWMKWSPGTLTQHASGAIMTGRWPEDSLLPVLVTVALLVAVLTVSVKALRSKELVG